MKLVNQKKWEERKRREELQKDAREGSSNRSISERVEHCKVLQYEKHQELFSVQYTSIHKAAYDNSLHGMKYFISPFRETKHHVDEYDKNGCTPLHLAAERGSNEVISLIIEQGCEANIPTLYGNTPLMYACKENKLETIRILVSAGADPYKQNKAGLTAIHFAAQSDAVNGLSLLIDLLRDAQSAEKNKSGDSSLPDIVTSKSRKSIVPSDGFDPKPLLELPANNLSTPLHTASLFNSLQVVPYLISQKVAIDLKNSSGETPLHIAGRQKHFQVYKILLDAGASTQVRNCCEQTPQELLKDIV